ncbi:MAG: hypothetical protein VKK63_03590 [Synechococcus sp.]|nr:hypothetical protein [Synechococcus sp.]
MEQVAARRLALANDHEAAATDPSRDPEVLAVYRERFSWAAAGAAIGRGWRCCGSGGRSWRGD